MTDTPTDMWRLSAAELTLAYARHRLSPVDVVKELLARLDVLDSHLHAFLAVDPDGALSAARTAERAWRDAGRRPPLLCGVPVTVKDTIEVEGMPTTYGSLAFAGRQAPDSEIARRLRAAGAVIVGKTNVSEFALSTYTMNRLTGPAANPWDLDRTAGGSSGGASAAVAAGLGPIALGTDSAGSIRLPAAYTGVLGVKPTADVIPAMQQWRASPTRSHNGVLTRTVEDAVLAMRALTSPVRSDLPGAHLRTAFVARKRIGVIGDPSVDPDPSGRAARLLADAGADTVLASPPPTDTPPSELTAGTWAFAGDHYQAAEGLTPGFWDKHAGDLTEYAYPIYEAGRRALAWQYRMMLDHVHRYAAALRDWFGAYDYVITPACAVAPPQPTSAADGGLGPRYPLLSMWNFAGNPAISVPFGFGDDGLPVAVQVIGRPGDDAGTLSVAATLEQQHPWRDAWPDLASRRVEVSGVMS
ncbi:MAG: hypothetical protein GEV10_01730 [Streptosporangiales bacterium]|nr:hypothetical protein [Streptosporangiales bacterium]